MQYVYVVLDSYGMIVGVFSEREKAESMIAVHDAPCRISCEPVIK